MTEAIRENAVKIEGRQYVVVGTDHFRFPVGTVTTLIEDDGTDNPFFEDVIGSNYPYGVAMNMHEVMLLAETEEKAEESALAEHKYSVGQKLAVSNNKEYYHEIGVGEEVLVTKVGGLYDKFYNSVPMYRVESVMTSKEQTLLETQLDPVPTHITQEQYAVIEVGDTIVIRDDLETGIYGNDSVTEEMLDYRGEQLKVDSIREYTNKVGSKSWNWTQQMISEVIKKWPVAEKPEFEPEEGHIYSTEKMILKVNSISENKLYGAGLYSFMGYQLLKEGDSACSASLYNRHEPLTPATDEQKIQLLKAMAEHGDATDSDLELLSELMPLDNPELEVGEVYFRGINTGNTWIFRYAETSNFGIPFHSAISPNADKFFSEAHMNIGDYRKALPHEVAKLEAAEKEHGCEYKKPLINSKGTVIEVGQYYTSSDEVLKVTEITDTLVKYDGYKMPKMKKPKHESASKNSSFARGMVPATPEKIADFKAAESRSKIQIGQTYKIEIPDSNVPFFKFTVTGADEKNFNVAYAGISGRTVSDNFPKDNHIWNNAELVE